MAELNDWQWAIGATVLIASLVLGGWLSRERIDDGEDSEPQVVNEPAAPNTATATDDTSELNQLQQQPDAVQAIPTQQEKAKTETKELRQQLTVRERELQEAREEAELTLLQLHQVQEELEHYFLESRELQQKLDAVQTITPAQQEQLKRINARLLKLFKAMPAASIHNTHPPSSDQLEALVQRQQNALRRFKRLQAKSTEG